MTTILWLSRHPPLPKQIAELDRIFWNPDDGNPSIVIHRGPVRDAEHVLNLLSETKADEVVAVLPLTIIQRLTRIGVRPIWAEMELVGDPAKADYVDPGSKRAYRFKEFRRIKSVRIEFEPLRGERHG